MAVTIQQIAKKAGVSIAAVSKALNNRKDISKATAQKIKRIAESLGYSVNIAARMLVTRKTGVIGVVAAFPENPTVIERLRGIAAEAACSDYLTSIAFHNGSVEEEIKQIQLTRGRIDGVIITPSNQSAKIARTLMESDLPVVLMSEPLAGIDADFIGTDEEEGGRLAAQHAASIGCKKIAYLGSSKDTPSDGAVLRGLMAHLPRQSQKNASEYVLWNNTDMQATHQHIDQLMNYPQPPDCIVAYSDLAALWALQRIKARGLRVPQDVAVIGFDNIEFSALCTPALTSISQPNIEIGKAAFRTLMERIQNGSAAAATRRIIFKPELVCRASTERV